jgi:hypothetical protein
MFLIRRIARADWAATVEPTPGWEEPQVWTLLDLRDPQVRPSTDADATWPLVTIDEL